MSNIDSRPFAVALESTSEREQREPYNMTETSNRPNTCENPGFIRMHEFEQGYGIDDGGDEISTPDVLHRIECVVATIVVSLDRVEVPEMVQYNHQTVQSRSTTGMKKSFTIQQSRSFTSMVLVMAYCHKLLQSTDEYGRTRSTTTREVYYFYITHFHSQRECDTAIRDVCTLLAVPRHSLGLHASSKGWFCGGFRLLDAHNGTVQWNGHAYRGDKGCPISSEWLLPSKKRSFVLDLSTTATSIVVVEKEGIYQRLVQDGFCDQHDCILATGKGFPDLSTRALVYTLYQQLQLPVFGLADCDPFGVAVLNCYCGGIADTSPLVDRRGNHYAVPMYWLGLRPSQVQYLSQPTIFCGVSYRALPSAIFQPLTDIDRQRLMDHFWNEAQPFMMDQHPARLHETHEMISMKVELEALYWLGMEFCSMFVGFLLHSNANHLHHRNQPDLSNEITDTKGNHLHRSHEIADTEEVKWSWMDII